MTEKVLSIGSVITVFAGEEINWPSHMNQTALQQSFIPLNDLINCLIDSKAKLAGTSSLKEWEQIHKYLEVMQQPLFHSLKDVPPSFS